MREKEKEMYRNGATCIPIQVDFFKIFIQVATITGTRELVDCC